jgi:hypothetical protein
VKITCYFNPEYVHNTTCKLRAIKRNLKRIELGATITNSLDDVWVRNRIKIKDIIISRIKKTLSFQFRLRHMKKTNANRYMPGLFDITQNLCELTAPHSTTAAFFRNFAANIYTNFNLIMDTVRDGCPIKVSFSFA